MRRARSADGSPPAVARRLLLGLACCLLAACVSAPPALRPEAGSGAHWQGKLALRTLQAPLQSFSARFDLQGAPDAGSLVLSSPFGTVLAELQWDAQSASLRTPNTARHYATLEQLAQDATGVPVPVGSLFAWLQGQPDTVPGWDADLSALAQGRLLATRTVAGQGAELRLLLEH